MGIEDTIKDLLNDNSQGDPEKNSKIMWEDFVRTMAVMYFKEMCEKSDNPKETANSIIDVWEKRILDKTEEDIKQLNDAEDDDSIFGVLGSLFGGMLPSSDDIMTQIKTAIASVSDILRQIPFEQK